MRTIIAAILITSIAFFLFGEKLDSSSWGAALSGVASAMALFISALTYTGWQKQKIRDDAYLTKKLYISTLIQIEKNAIQIDNHIQSLVPKAGTLLPSDTLAISTLDKVVEQRNEIQLHTQLLDSTASELLFWGAALSDASVIDLERLKTSMQEHLECLQHLHHGLSTLYIQKYDSDSIAHWESAFRETNNKIFQIFKSRKSKNMHSTFLR
jgi:hypothetical protein